MNKQKCPDCDADLTIPSDYVNGEIFQCPCCSLEMEYKDGKLIELTMEGVDWGEHKGYVVHIKKKVS